MKTKEERIALYQRIKELSDFILDNPLTHDKDFNIEQSQEQRDKIDNAFKELEILQEEQLKDIRGDIDEKNNSSTIVA